MADLLFSTNGGLGYCLALSQVLSEAAEKYEHIYAISPYTDVFKSSPYVTNTYSVDVAKAAFEDIDMDNTYIATGRVYDDSDFIKKKLNYCNAFRRWLNLEEKPDEVLSHLKIDLDPSSNQITVNCYNQIMEDIKKKGYSDFVLMQFYGGQSPIGFNNNSVYDYESQGLKRAYTKGQELIDLYKAQHPTTAVIMYQLPNEPRYKGTEVYTAPYMTYNLLAKDPMCSEIICIDSSLQHLTAGIKPATVIWAHTVPECFGYEYNKNVVQKCKRDGIIYFNLLGKAANRVEETPPNEILK